MYDHYTTGGAWWGIYPPYRETCPGCGRCGYCGRGGYQYPVYREYYTTPNTKTKEDLDLDYSKLLKTMEAFKAQEAKNK